MQLSDLTKESKDPESEYQKSLAEFDRIDKLLEERKKTKATLEQQGNSAEAKALEAKLVDLQKIWTLAKSRSELEIDGRKTLELQITTLQDKLQRDRAALDKLIGTPAPATTGGPAKSETAPVAVPPVQASRCSSSTLPRAGTGIKAGGGSDGKPSRSSSF